MSFWIFPREAVTNNSGKGGDNRGSRRRTWRRRGNNQENQEIGNISAEKGRLSYYERPKWIPPKISTEPLPSPDCPFCGKPIRDIASALEDKVTNKAVHFDCAINRIVEAEILEKGDVVAYIGGGRFGVVHFNNPGEIKRFSIKRIYEWENKDSRAGWRNIVSDHYTIT